MPAVLWNRAFRAEVAACGSSEPVAIALEQRTDSVSVFRDRILPAGHPLESRNPRTYEIDQLLGFPGLGISYVRLVKPLDQLRDSQ